MSANVEFSLTAGGKTSTFSLASDVTIADLAMALRKNSRNSMLRFTVADGCTPSQTTTLGDLFEQCGGQLTLVCEAEKTLGSATSCCCCSYSAPSSSGAVGDSSSVLGGNGSSQGGSGLDGLLPGGTGTSNAGNVGGLDQLGGVSLPGLAS